MILVRLVAVCARVGLEWIYHLQDPGRPKCWPGSDIWSTTWARGTRPLVCVPPRTGTHWYLANCVPPSYVRVMCGHSSPAVGIWLLSGLVVRARPFSLALLPAPCGTPLGCALRWVPPPRAAITRHLGRLVVAWVPAPGVTPPVVCSVGAPTFEQRSRAIWVAWWLAWVLGPLGRPPLLSWGSLLSLADYVQVS